MEKRFYLGAGILVVFLLLGLLTMIWMDNANGMVVQDLEAAAQAAQQGDLSQGTRLAREAAQKWQSCWKGIAVVADHSPMDEIDSLFAQMDYYGKAGNAADFGACCARLRQLVEAVTDAHRLTWWNVL